MNRCPDCGSTQCILWDDGLLCLDCGTEFDEVKRNYDHGDIEQ